jgi:hypothetical protein
VTHDARSTCFRRRRSPSGLPLAFAAIAC